MCDACHFANEMILNGILKHCCLQYAFASAFVRCRNRIPEKQLVVQRLHDLMAKKWVHGTGMSCITQLTLDPVESMKRIILDDRLSGIQAA